MPPAVNVPCATLVMDRSKLEVSGVGPLETGPLLALQPAHSFGFDTVARFAGSGLAALAAMFTSSTSTLLPPEAIRLALVQVGVGTAPVHVQPGVEIALTL